MMGRQTGDQSQLFYLFNLERRIPAGHLLRRLNPIVTRVLFDLREKLAAFYSDIGRRPDPLTPIEETLRALDDLVRAGRVRYIGCPNFSAAQMVEAILGFRRPASPRHNL